MHHFTPSLPLIIAVLGLGALPAAAQSNNAAAAPSQPAASKAPATAVPAAASSPVFSATATADPVPAIPPPGDDHGDQRHIQSAELADALTNAMPKYNPPSKTDPAKSGDEEADARDTDKPKNAIIRLPQYVVREPKSPVFTEREDMTQKGLDDLAMKRYLGLDPSKMNSPLAATITRLLFQSYANQEYADAERLNNISDLDQTALAMAHGGDSADAGIIKRAADDIYDRGLDEQSGLDEHAGWGAPVPSESEAMGNYR